MNIGELKIKYRNLLQPIFGEQFRIDDSEEGKDWVVIILGGKQEEFRWLRSRLPSLWTNSYFF